MNQKVIKDDSPIWRKPMVNRLLVFAVLLSAAIGSAIFVRATPQESQRQSTEMGYVAWVGQSLKRMETIQPGMTRSDLLKVFTKEGGISTALHRTFISRDCPYFHVDVEFKAVGRPNRDASGRESMIEGSQDTIVKISRPYLESPIAD
jgi:hypothetical protein